MKNAEKMKSDKFRFNLDSIPILIYLTILINEQN